jgi:hypothetical protein
VDGKMKKKLKTFSKLLENPKKMHKIRRARAKETIKEEEK